jgi:acyl-homoserine lactone acylase PvdQ
MRSRIVAILAVIVASATAGAQAPEAARWQAEAARVTITRDDWGIAHIHGKSDADAVFGMIYAQCEDDFNRVEANYLTALGRTAEAEGESKIWQDLRQRLFIDPEELKKDYAASPAWLKALMNAWADGINFYLATHPEIHPKVLTRFEPWMALSFTEGSIGGDIERVDLKKLQAFYDHQTPAGVSFVGKAGEPASGSLATNTTRAPFIGPLCSAMSGLSETPPAYPTDDPTREPSGSNGIAIAPSNTLNHHALLLINPHTSFYFRSELQMTSDEGLNAYGAVTWGQFFIYQGFNAKAGWMHTSSGVDAVDEFIEKENGSKEVACNVCGYLYGGTLHQFGSKLIVLRYSSVNGVKERAFTGIYTVHGPVVRRDAGQLYSIKLMNIPIPALEQSYLRTKATNYAEYRKTMELQANSSNNTIFADADGDIAYWHGNFIPRRDARFDYTKPVDGSDPATDWHGLLPLDQTPQLRNPASGYLFNVNDSPWNGAGSSSLKQSDFPAYVEQGIESARGTHAMRVLAGRKDFTLDSLLAAAFDSYQPWFARTLPKLIAAYDALPANSPDKPKLSDAVDLLRKWDYRWSAQSNQTTLAVYWGTDLLRQMGAQARAAHQPSEDYIATTVPAETLIKAMEEASIKVLMDFKGFTRAQAEDPCCPLEVPAWGEVNRFQRLNDDIVARFDDTKPSLPVPFSSALWGSLASFGARQYPNTKKWYGTSGNSFVAVVEFGDKVYARAVTAGGESGSPASKHFTDEAERYASGNLREVYFYPEQLVGHTEKVYRPGAQSSPAASR